VRDPTGQIPLPTIRSNFEHCSRLILKTMATKSKRFEARLDPKLDSDISDLLEEFPELGDKSEFARKAFSLYMIAKRREKANGEKISMVKDGRPTVELVGI
jgi:hypothetical protein